MGFSGQVSDQVWSRKRTLYSIGISGEEELLLRKQRHKVPLQAAEVTLLSKWESCPSVCACNQALVVPVLNIKRQRKPARRPKSMASFGIYFTRPRVFLKSWIWWLKKKFRNLVFSAFHVLSVVHVSMRNRCASRYHSITVQAECPSRLSLQSWARISISAWLFCL